MDVTHRECRKYIVSMNNCPSYDLSQFLPLSSGVYRQQVNYIQNCPKAHIPVPYWDTAAAGEVEAPAELCSVLRGELAGARGFGQNICGEGVFLYISHCILPWFSSP